MIILTAIALVLSGLFFVAFAHASRLATAHKGPGEGEQDPYTLIGW